MNKSLFAAAGFALVLTACAATGERGAYKPFGAQAKNIAYASVSVINDQMIVVGQEPIYVKQTEDNALYWYLDPAGPYYFPDTKKDKGIDFDTRPLPGAKCNADPQDNKTFICTYKRANRGKYPYTIKVTKDGTNILKSDPTVMND